MTDSSRMVELMEEYFRQRKEKGLDSTYFRRKLELLGKTETQIHEILIELDDDWHKDLVLRDQLKAAMPKMVMGAILSLGCITFSILSAMGLIFQGGVILVAYGLIIFGVGLFFSGFGARGNYRQSVRRRNIKYALYD